MHWRSSQVDVLQPGPGEYCEDRGPPVYSQSMPPSATSVTNPSGHQSGQASFRFARLLHLHWLRCIEKVAYDKDCSCLFCDPASVAECLSFMSAFAMVPRFQALRCPSWRCGGELSGLCRSLRRSVLSVSGVLSRHTAVGLWQTNADRYLVPADEAGAVGDECCCSHRIASHRDTTA